MEARIHRCFKSTCYGNHGPSVGIGDNGFNGSKMVDLINFNKGLLVLISEL